MIKMVKNTVNKNNTLITLSALLMCLGSLSLDAAPGTGTPKVKAKVEPKVESNGEKPGTVFNDHEVKDPTKKNKEDNSADSIRTSGDHVSKGNPQSESGVPSSVNHTSLNTEPQAIAKQAAEEEAKFKAAAQDFNDKSPLKREALQDSTTITTAAKEEAEAALSTLSAEVVKENNKQKIPSNDPAHEGMGTIKALVAEIIQKDFINKDKQPTNEDLTMAVSKASDIYLKMKVLETNDPKKLAQELTAEQKADLEKKKKEFCKCLGTCGI